MVSGWKKDVFKPKKAQKNPTSKTFSRLIKYHSLDHLYPDVVHGLMLYLIEKQGILVKYLLFYHTIAIFRLPIQ